MIAFGKAFIKDALTSTIYFFLQNESYFAISIRQIDFAEKLTLQPLLIVPYNTNKSIKE
jgi:hypothetical protein